MRTLIYFFITLLCMSCIQTRSTKVEDDILLVDIIGAYIGNLPCVDCECINTILHLEKDHSYKLTYMYEGKSNEEFVKEGTWKVNKDELVLNGLDYKYHIEHDHLKQLDLSGEIILGDLAEQYQMSKIK